MVLSSNGDESGITTIIDVNDDSAIIEVVVENVSKLDVFESKAVNVRGIDWQFIVEKRDDVLDVYLRARSEIIPGTIGTIKQANTYDVEATFQLLSFDPKGDWVKRSLDLTGYSAYFKWGAAKKGCRDFIKWNDFMDKTKQFVEDDSAIFVVRFTVAEPISILDRPNPTLP